jgi:hypothetical protein
MLSSPGLRVAIAGGIVFFLAAASLIFLPKIIGAAGMLAGGCAVFGGFLQTMFSWYAGGGPHPPDQPG